MAISETTRRFAVDLTTADDGYGENDVHDAAAGVTANAHVTFVTEGTVVTGATAGAEVTAVTAMTVVHGDQPAAPDERAADAFWSAPTTLTYVPSVERSAWLLGLAATLATDEPSDADAAKELVVVAEGDHAALEGAYGRCLALVSVLPDDGNARRALDLLRRAIRLSESL